MTASPPAPRAFNPDELNSKGLGPRLTRAFIDNPQWLFAILRRVKPVLKVGNWAFVTRYDDVAKVLREKKAFGVPFGPKIEALNNGPNFLLGMADGSDYRALRDKVAAIFPQEELTSRVVPISAQAAE